MSKIILLMSNFTNGTRWSDNIDLKLMRSVGENLAATLRKQTTILEHMMHENVLNDFYVKGLGLDRYTDFLSNAVLQLSHRYSNMNILEIGKWFFTCVPKNPNVSDGTNDESGYSVSI